VGSGAAHTAASSSGGSSWPARHQHRSPASAAYPARRGSATNRRTAGNAAAARWTSCSVSAGRAAPSSAACGGTAANGKVTRWEMAPPTVAHG
jgi:hypothetical protein